MWWSAGGGFDQNDFYIISLILTETESWMNKAFAFIANACNETCVVILGLGPSKYILIYLDLGQVDPVIHLFHCKPRTPFVLPYTQV
jgi:hypothetical protein